MSLRASLSACQAAFAASGQAARLHAALVAKTLGHREVGHISRDATATHVAGEGDAEAAAAEAEAWPSARGG